MNTDTTITKKIINEKPTKFVFSNPQDKQEKYKKVTIYFKNEYYQIEIKTVEQVFHANIQIDELESNLIELMKKYRQMNAWNDEYELLLTTTKKGKINYKKIKNKLNKQECSDLEHNRKKNYILEEGVIIEPLIDMDVFTAEGKVVKSMYSKFKQINRFVEMIDDTIKNLETKRLNIIDFGCGKSYLTFILYYYLTKAKEIEVNMIGLDLKEEVVKNCNKAARKYGYEGLKFEVGDISGFEIQTQVDMVITLHACDVATDYALYSAIKWDAKMIFSVPCCQHELNSQIKADDLSIITRYGIAQERISALFTDIIRCNLLQYSSYKTQMLEFVDLSHTPKNVLIRAVKSNIPKDIRNDRLKEVNDLVEKFELEPTLLKLLTKDECQVSEK
ncbi:MAG: class I SAM-dependent methyltransferase [Alkaliphilus sp.]